MSSYAWRSIGMGCLSLLLSIGVAAAHYVFKVPIDIGKRPGVSQSFTIGLIIGVMVLSSLVMLSELQLSRCRPSDRVVQKWDRNIPSGAKRLRLAVHALEPREACLKFQRRVLNT